MSKHPDPSPRSDLGAAIDAAARLAAASRATPRVVEAVDAMDSAAAGEFPRTSRAHACLHWGGGKDALQLVVPAGTSHDSALSLAASLMSTSRDLAREALDDEGAAAGSVRWAITWLSEIAAGITAAVQFDLEQARYRASQEGQRHGE